MSKSAVQSRCRVVVIWIDWYPYHVARLRGLLATAALAGSVVGLEMVGGIGVHAGLKFREDLPADLPIQTLMPGTGWKDANQFTLARLLWRKLSELDSEIVLVPGYSTLPGIAAALWARTHGAVSVLMTESTAYDHSRTWWKEGIKSLALRALFNWAIAGGKEHVKYLHQLRFPRERIVTAYDVIDNAFFRLGTDVLRAQSSPAQHGLPASPYFLYVGRLAPEKNVVTLLGSWLKYREQGGSWPLVLVGDGPEAGILRSIAAASPFAAQVHFPGLKSSRELLPFYAFAGCFVLPSSREPWGLVVNEAMASGLPVLVSNRCGCAPDLVSVGGNGFLLDPTDGSAITELLSKVAQLSPALRAHMGNLSTHIVSEFSPAHFGHSIASIAAHSVDCNNVQQSLDTAATEFTSGGVQ